MGLDELDLTMLVFILYIIRGMLTVICSYESHASIVKNQGNFDLSSTVC